MRLGSGLLSLLLSGCLLFGGASEVSTPVRDPDVIEFAGRIQDFYASLVGIPLDTLLTYEDSRLIAYFGSESDFTDYYAALATEVREATLRNSRAREIEIVEFRFSEPDVARVDLILRGDHNRGLLFWDVELARTDTWRRVDGLWLLDPERL